MKTLFIYFPFLLSLPPTLKSSAIAFSFCRRVARVEAMNKYLRA
jgi:hypothetical protein